MGQYRLLPEWDPQRAILINWPYQNSSNWNPVWESVNKIYLSIVRSVALQQSLMIVCHDLDQRDKIQNDLVEANVNLPRVRFFVIPSDDIWIRDYGPLVLRHQQNTRILSFQFNGWGKKYPAARDNLVVQQLYQQSFFPMSEFNSVDFVLEGSSIDTDGGCLMTTKSCLLANNRNPDYTDLEIETLLKNQLGIERILWLEHGDLAGDDTDGHIDNIVRFISPEIICYSECLDPADEHYASFKTLYQQLKTFKNIHDRSYQLVPLPLPGPICSQIDGRRLPATYTQFLITNQLVLMPFYEDSQDQVAKAMLQSCFPNRKVVGIPSLVLLENYGSLHGMAVQIPI